MGSLPPELSLDLRPSFVPRTIGAFLEEISRIGDFSEKRVKVDGFVKRLEEELGKIDAFKRELPLCMVLLNDAILGLKDELLQLTPPKAQPEPVLEEFIPMKKESENEGNEENNETSDKKNWMSNFQLYDYQSVDPPKHKEIKRKEEEEDSNTSEVSEFQIQNCEKSDLGGKAFLPFSGFPVAMLRKDEREELPVPSLSLLMPGTKNLREESGSSGSKTCYSRAGNVTLGAGPSLSQSVRKQRRCWSPELHRRFVNALQQLGGSQVATPKQIREHMQVDGLTNDEVKSHLQKYRLHTRKATANQSIVMTLQDHCSQSSKPNSSQSGSPQGPFQLGTHDSTAGGDSMDDDEDEEEKSESYSWKTHVHKPIISGA